MFRKLRIQLTIFFTLGTGFILAAMSGGCLYISQKSIDQNSYNNFLNSTSSIYSYLEAQSMISHQWLLEQELNNHFSIKILDNQQPLFFTDLKEEPKLTQLYTQALKEAQEKHSLNLDTYTAKNILSQHVEFSMSGTDQKKYYTGVAFLPKENGFLTAIILYPLDLLYAQKNHLRFIFLAAVFLGILCLGIFSWFFTRHLLSPIEESRRKQTQFIASASHELRTPLAVLRSCLCAVQKSAPSETEHFYRIMEQETERMTLLIQDMLLLANADNHSWTVSMAPTELDTLLLDIYEKYEPLSKEKNKQLCIQLPELSCPPYKCDKNRIQQVLSIFIDNAFSYTPDGSKITLLLKQTKEYFILSVADNGPGIPPEEKEAVFQRFYHSDQSRHKKGHYGLGLSIALEIARLHHGSLKLSDTPGGGATFTLLLPFVK